LGAADQKVSHHYRQQVDDLVGKLLIVVQVKASYQYELTTLARHSIVEDAVMVRLVVSKDPPSFAGLVVVYHHLAEAACYRYERVRPEDQQYFAVDDFLAVVEVLRTKQHFAVVLENLEQVLVCHFLAVHQCSDCRYVLETQAQKYQKDEEELYYDQQLAMEADVGLVLLG
jgi:hypothetical protein